LLLFNAFFETKKSPQLEISRRAEGSITSTNKNGYVNVGYVCTAGTAVLVVISQEEGNEIVVGSQAELHF